MLSFRGTGRIRLGHVAVVRKVVNPREIEIDHAHWAGGAIYRNVPVIDVSPDNDWTAVRVALRRGGAFGSVYATNGFIYDRTPNARIQTATASDRTPEARVQTASAAVDSTPVAGDDAPVSGVRAHHRRHWHRLVARRRVYAEVAELPVQRGLNLNLDALASHISR